MDERESSENNFRIKTVHYKTKNSKQIEIRSKILKNFIKDNFLSKAKNKIIPEWIFNLPKNKIEFLIKGLMASDRHITKSGSKQSVLLQALH